MTKIHFFKRITLSVLMPAFLASSFLLDPHLLKAEGSSLELQYLLLYDDAWNDLREKTVRSGSELTLQVKYARKGFSEDCQTTLRVEIFDDKGNVVLQGEEGRPASEGTRIDKYRFTIPQNISGSFLAVLTVRINQGEEKMSEVSSQVPFDVVNK